MNVQRWIEFHDSELLGIEPEADWLVLSLDAFIHQWERIDGVWSGTGWMQPVALRLEAAVLATHIAFPVDISEGSLTVGATRVGNMVPLPFEATEATSLDLVFVDGGRATLRAAAVALLEVGAARYIERLTDDLRPADAAEGFEVDAR